MPAVSAQTLKVKSKPTKLALVDCDSYHIVKDHSCAALAYFVGNA